jgi:DNA-binding response OmpR family regulator
MRDGILFGVMTVKAKILVVDDEISVGTMIVFLLTRGGCEAEMARNAAQAVNLAQANEYDLITLDVELPGTSGFEIYQQLKEIPQLKDTPVVFVSGRPTMENIQRAFDLGAADFIEKPFAALEFVPRLLSHVKLARPLDVLDESADADMKGFCKTT